jgi:PleD family two-component response regulator
MSTHSLKEDSPLFLVVDDDKSMRMLIRTALEEEGYQVVEAHNGEACIATYRKHQPDAILLDAVMPVMDGFACCRELRTLTDRDTTPILMITVLDDPDSVDCAFEVGANDYITKPIHWSVLRHRVGRLLQESVQKRQVESLLEKLEQVNQELERLARKLARYEGKDLP